LRLLHDLASKVNRAIEAMARQSKLHEEPVSQVRVMLIVFSNLGLGVVIGLRHTSYSLAPDIDVHNACCLNELILVISLCCGFRIL
jgi:hypothetical protein